MRSGSFTRQEDWSGRFIRVLYKQTHYFGDKNNSVICYLSCQLIKNKTTMCLFLQLTTL